MRSAILVVLGAALAGTAAGAPQRDDSVQARRSVIESEAEPVIRRLAAALKDLRELKALEEESSDPAPFLVERARVRGAVETGITEVRVLQTRSIRLRNEDTLAKGVRLLAAGKKARDPGRQLVELFGDSDTGSRLSEAKRSGQRALQEEQMTFLALRRRHEMVLDQERSRWTLGMVVSLAAATAAAVIWLRRRRPAM